MSGMIEKQSLLKAGKERYKAYGIYVVLNRALPDFRDGLKPVHRRILWAMYKMGIKPTGQFYKSQRIVSETAGKYHTHGDAAIYDTFVGMANLPIRLVDGQGNFGSWKDPPAASRYTEARLTKYSATQILNPDYLDTITPKVPNYDGLEMEPLFLPALMPNVLLNGTQGIAFGITGYIPPIHPDALMPLIEMSIKGKDITSKMIKKRLKFNWNRGGNNCVSSDEEVLEWLTSGSGPLRFEPTYEYNENKRTITFSDVPPNFNWEGTAEKAYKKPWVSSCEDLTDKHDRKAGKPARIVVKIKSSISYEEFNDKAEEIVNMFSNSIPMATNITIRNGENESDILLKRHNIPELINAWCDYRIDLEVQVQKHNINMINKALDYQDLMLLALANKDIIRKCWDVEKPVKFLSEKLKITDEQSNIILDKATRAWTKINKEQIHKKIKELKQEKSQAIKYRNEPNPKVLSDMNEGLKTLHKT